MRLYDGDTPLGLVRIYADDYQTMDLLRQKAAGKYPPECYLPIGAAMAVLEHNHGYDRTAQATLGSELTALYTWRKTKVMYNFDDGLTEALADQALDMQANEKLPIDLLLHLPYPCIYIKSGYIRDLYQMDGFFAWIEWDEGRKEYEFRTQLVAADMQASVGLVLHLSKPTLGECLAETSAETVKHWPAVQEATGFRPNMRIRRPEDAKTPNPVYLALQMVLYLQADNHEEEEDREQRAVYRRAKARNQVGARSDDPSSIRLNNVGVRIGAALRKAKAASSSSDSTGTGTGSKKQTHLRRGHWHHYWTGSQKDGSQKLILKWTAPTIVNPPEDGTEPGAIIYPVKGWEEHDE